MLHWPPSEKQLINSWCFKLFNLSCLVQLMGSLMILFEVHHCISTFSDDAIWGSSWHVYIFEVHLGMSTFSDDAFEVHHGISTFSDDAFWGSSWYIYIRWWCYLRFIMVYLHSLMMLFEVHQGISTFFDDAIWGFIKVYLHFLMMLF